MSCTFSAVHPVWKRDIHSGIVVDGDWLIAEWMPVSPGDSSIQGGCPGLASCHTLLWHWFLLELPTSKRWKPKLSVLDLMSHLCILFHIALTIMRLRTFVSKGCSQNFWIKVIDWDSDFFRMWGILILHFLKQKTLKKGSVVEILVS